MDKLKKSLQLCIEKKCEDCHYNRWVREVCQTQLCRDVLKYIEKHSKEVKINGN